MDNLTLDYGHFNLEEAVVSAVVGGSKFEVLNPLMLEFERKAEAGEICDDMEVLKKVFAAFDEYMGRARPVLSPLQTLELDNVFGRSLKCIIYLSICNKEAHDYVLEETCVMETLTSCLNDKYNLEHEKVILETLDVLTRRLKVQWPAPYLSSLIKSMFQRIVMPTQSTEVFNYCLRILTNLVSHSSCCLNIAARDANYREVMKILVTMMGRENCYPHSLMLMTHLSYLIEPSVNVKTSLMAKYVKASLAKIIADYVNAGVRERNDAKHSLASHIFYLGRCISTILSQLGKEHEDEFANMEIVLSQNAGGTGDGGAGGGGRSLINRFVRDITKRIITDIFQILPLIQKEFPQMVVETLLGLITACFPHCIPDNVFDTDVLESLIKCIDTLASITRPKTISHLVVLKTYNHFVGRILTAHIRHVPDEIFHNAFNSCQIVPASNPKDLIRNVETIRLLLHFTNMVTFNDLIKKHLDESQLLKLAECLLAEKTDLIKPPSLQKSMCLVEALNVLSMISKCPTVLMGSIQKEQTLIHIANCIVNGDDALISKGLSLTGAVGFTQKCRSDLSKILVAMREISTKNGSTDVTNEDLITMSDKARFGIKKLNNNLEMFMQTYDGNDYAVDDILAWHKLKSDMHEAEVTSMRDQIFQLGRTIAQFKVLINKQADLITKRAASTAIIQKDHKNLKQMVDSMKEKKIELEIKHAKTTDALRKQLNFQEGLYKVKSERLDKLEVQVVEFKAETKKLEAAKKEATDSVIQLMAENATIKKQLGEVEVEAKTSKQRVASLEKDLKKSEESRKATESLLEAERRKTEIIQQVLGNRQ